MTASGYHAADDGSLARSTGGAAARGALLIALALAIGLLLVTFALDDPQTEIVAADTDAAAVDDGEGAGDGGEGDLGAAPEVGEPTDNGDGTTAETIPPLDDELVVDPPVEGVIDGPTGQLLPANEVNVLVANGTGGAGVAGGISNILVADGYTTAVTNAPGTEAGVIFYQPGFDQNALAIAETLGAAPDVVSVAPESIGVSAEAIADGRLDSANIVIIVGTNNAVPPA